MSSPGDATKLHSAVRAGTVESVAADPEHRFSKRVLPEIRLLAGLGVEGDAHRGVTVQHRSRVAVDPTRPNLRQVHLIHAELLDSLAERGFRVAAGDLGENVLTRGLDLLALPRGALLHIGPEAVVEVTGLRNPCHQIEDFRAGLVDAVLARDASGVVRPLTGVMSIVRAGGLIRPGDAIRVSLPAAPHQRLEKV